MTYVEKLLGAIANIRGTALRTDPYDVDLFLKSIAALAEETGVKLVAREPTEVMCEVLWGDEAKEQWREAFDAAPAVPEEVSDV